MARKSRRDKAMYARMRRRIRTRVKSARARSLIRLRSLRKMKYGKYRVRHGKVVRVNPGIPGLEEKARVIGNSKVLLRKRFSEAKSVMYPFYASKFKGATLDFENKRMISKDKKFFMQWTNEGLTSRGSVTVHEVIARLPGHTR